MRAQYQLVPLKKSDQLTPKLSTVKNSLRETVLRLLHRQNQELKTSAKSTREPIWLYIDPQSWVVNAWSFLFMIVFYLVELQISLSVAFGPNFFQDEIMFSSAYRSLYIFFLSFLVFDIFLSFFMGYYAIGKGKVVDDPVKIVIYYLKHQFVFDAITVLLYSVPLIYQSFGLNFLQLVTAGLLWIKKFKYQDLLQFFLQYSAALRAGFMLFILFIDALMFGNFGACIFIWMDVYLYNESYFGTNTLYYWLTNNQDYSASLINGPWYYQYVYGQFFSTGTLSTLAPGPFAKNPYEAIYAIFLMILFMIYASYLADVLIQIVYTYALRRMSHEENIRAFDNFMRLKEVGQNIRLRVYNYFELKWELEFKTESTQQELMISKLPKYLKEQLLLEIGFTNHMYFLQKLPHENILKRMISLKIQRTTADADTVIFLSHQPKVKRQPRSLFFIKEGMAKFFLSDSQRKGEAQDLMRIGREPVLSLSNVERVLGVYQFITGQDYSVSCKSIDLCLIQTLSWTNFSEILSEMKIKQEFEEMRHKILIERQLSLIHKSCIICLQSHVESECPHLHFSKIFQKSIIADNRQSHPNKRRQKKRRQLNSKKIMKVTQTVEQGTFMLGSKFNIGTFLMELLKIELQEDIQIQEMCSYRKYYPEYNMKDMKVSK